MFQLVEKEYRQAMRRRLLSIGSSMISGTEGVKANSTLRIGQTKGQILRFLDSVKSYLSKTQKLSFQVASILGKERVGESREVCLPFIVAETDGNFEGQRNWLLKVPGGTEAYGFFEGLDAGIHAIDAGKSEWVPPDDEHRRRVAEHFFSRLETSGLDARVSAQIKALFDASDWTTMKDGLG